jgi:hypothetical protein
MGLVAGSPELLASSNEYASEPTSTCSATVTQLTVLSPYKFSTVVTCPVSSTVTGYTTNDESGTIVGELTVTILGSSPDPDACPSSGNPVSAQVMAVYADAGANAGAFHAGVNVGGWSYTASAVNYTWSGSYCYLDWAATYSSGVAPAPNRALGSYFDLNEICSLAAEAGATSVSTFIPKGGFYLDNIIPNACSPYNQ